MTERRRERGIYSRSGQGGRELFVLPALRRVSLIAPRPCTCLRFLRAWCKFIPPLSVLLFLHYGLAIRSIRLSPSVHFVISLLREDRSSTRHLLSPRKTTLLSFCLNFVIDFFFVLTTYSMNVKRNSKKNRERRTIITDELLQPRWTIRLCSDYALLIIGLIPWGDSVSKFVPELYKLYHIYTRYCKSLLHVIYLIIVKTRVICVVCSVYFNLQHQINLYPYSTKYWKIFRKYF